MKTINLTTRETPEGGYALTATTGLTHLLEVYESKRFLDEIIVRMAERFVEDNYERLTTGINFEGIEASVLDMAKQKFGEMLKLEPKKPEPVYIRKRSEMVSTSINLDALPKL